MCVNFCVYVFTLLFQNVRHQNLSVLLLAKMLIVGIVKTKQELVQAANLASMATIVNKVYEKNKVYVYLHVSYEICITDINVRL